MAEQRKYSLRDYMTLCVNNKLEIRNDNTMTARMKELEEVLPSRFLMDLTRNEAKDLSAQLHLFSDDPEYSTDMFEAIGTLKGRLDGRGYAIKNIRPFADGSELTAFIQSGSTNGQIALAVPDSNENRLGAIKVKNKLIGRNESNVIPSTKVKRIMESVDYIFGYTDIDAKIERNKKGNLTVKGNDGVFYINNIPSSFSKGLAQKALESEYKPKTLEDVIKNAYDAYKRDIEQTVDLEEHPEERVLDFLYIEDQLKDENGNIDLRRVDMNILTRYADVTDVANFLRDEQIKFVQEGKGSARDFNELMMQDLSSLVIVNDVEYYDTDINDMMHQESFESFVGEMRSRYALNDKDAPDLYHRLASKVDMTKTLDDMSLEESISVKGEVEDEETARDLAMDGVNEALEDAIDFIDEGPTGSRQRMTNFLVGTVDENGEPLSGRMPESEETQMMKRLKVVAEQSAKEAGIKKFEAFYDNDNVLHWRGIQVIVDPNKNYVDENGNLHKGVKEVREIQQKIGQVFTPAEKDIYDENGNLVLKEGVLKTNYGSGVDTYRVPGYKGDFVDPNYNKKGQVTDFRHNLITRLKLTGLEQMLTTEIGSTIKSQALFRIDDDYSDTSFDEFDKVYDSTRLRNIYKETTPIDPNAMDRPGVVDQLRYSVRFDEKWLGLNSLLRDELLDMDPANPPPTQYIRHNLKGLEGVFDEEASSDGKVLGLRRVLTSEFVEFLDKNIDVEGFKFAQTGTLGKDGTLSNGEKTVLQRDFLDIPVEERQKFKSPISHILDSTYGEHDSPDRKLMAMKMIAVADNIIGGEFDTEGRDKVNVALMAVGGLTYEDSIIVSSEAAEKYGWRIGDKLADMHSNKGVISYIGGLDPDNPHYNADAEMILKNNPHVEMIQSPYGPATRANAGLIKELQDSSEIKEVVDDNGNVRGYQGELSIITTNMRAEKKVKVYELEDTNKTRHLSYQQYYVLQAHNAEGLLNEVFSDNNRSHETLAHYYNAIGLSVKDDGDLSVGHIGMNLETVKDSSVEGGVKVVESPTNDVFIVSPSDAAIKMPEGPSYLELPIEIDISAQRDLGSIQGVGDVKTSYIPLMPERLRKTTETFDGNFVENNYTVQLRNIVDYANALEGQKLNHLLDNEDYVLEHSNYESVDAFYEDYKNNRSKEAMDLIRQVNSDDFVGDAAVNAAKKLEGDLERAVRGYENRVIIDQFGKDHRSKKYSYIRRNIVAKDLPDSATSIITNDTSLPLDTVAISPVIAMNLGYIEAIDRDKFERAKASGSVDEMNEALKGNWKMKDGLEDDRVMLWRDPTLHDGSVAGFKVTINEDLIGTSINPFIISPMAMDFDGDQVGLYRAHTPEGQLSLKNEMNITNNLLDGNNKPIFSVGMDVVDNLATSEWGATKLAEYIEDGKDVNAKDLCNALISNRIAKAHREYIDALDNDLGERGMIQLDKYQKELSAGVTLSPEDAYDYKHLKEIRDTHLYARNEEIKNEMQKISDMFFKNEEMAISMKMDFRTDELAIESVERMIYNGSKGSAGSLARFEKYLSEGVSYEDQAQVREALAAKNDMTGIAGAGALRLSALLKHMETSDLNGFNEGARVALDIAEQTTQPVLDIKHTPANVPVVDRYLQNFRKCVMGPNEKYFEAAKKEEFREGYPSVIVDLDPGHYESLSAHLVDNEEDKSPIKMSTAKLMDGFMRDLQAINKGCGYDKSDPRYLYARIDINTGHMFAQQNDKDKANLLHIANNTFFESPDNVSLNYKEAYNLSVAAIFKEGGLTAPSQREIELIQHVVRDPKQGLLPYNVNLLENGSPIDILAQQGFDGVKDIVLENNKTLLLEDGDPKYKFGEKKWDKVVNVNYESLNENLVGEFIKTKDEYTETLEAIKEQKIELENNGYSLYDKVYDKEPAEKMITIDLNDTSDISLDDALKILEEHRLKAKAEKALDENEVSNEKQAIDTIEVERIESPSRAFKNIKMSIAPLTEEELKELQAKRENFQNKGHQKYNKQYKAKTASFDTPPPPSDADAPYNNSKDQNYQKESSQAKSYPSFEKNTYEKDFSKIKSKVKLDPSFENNIADYDEEVYISKDELLTINQKWFDAYTDTLEDRYKKSIDYGKNNGFEPKSSVVILKSIEETNDLNNKINLAYSNAFVDQEKCSVQTLADRLKITSEEPIKTVDDLASNIYKKYNNYGAKTNKTISESIKEDVATVKQMEAERMKEVESDSFDIDFMINNAVKEVEAVKEPVQKEAVVKDTVQKEATVKDKVQKEETVKEAVQKEATVKESVQKETIVKDKVQKEETAKESVQKETTVKDKVQKEAAVKDTAQKEETVKEPVQKEEMVKEADGKAFNISNVDVNSIKNMSESSIKELSENVSQYKEQVSHQKEEAKSEKNTAKSEKDAAKSEKDAARLERMQAKENGASKEVISEIKKREDDARARERMAREREKEAREREKEAKEREKEAKALEKEIKAREKEVCGKVLGNGKRVVRRNPKPTVAEPVAKPAQVSAEEIANDIKEDIKNGKIKEPVVNGGTTSKKVKVKDDVELSV